MRAGCSGWCPGQLLDSDALQQVHGCVRASVGGRLGAVRNGGCGGGCRGHERPSGRADVEGWSAGTDLHAAHCIGGCLPVLLEAQKGTSRSGARGHVLGQWNAERGVTRASYLRKL